VDAKSFRFLVVKGLAKLWVEEKRKWFSGYAVLGMRCTAWLMSMVEEELGNPRIEDFVKSFTEASKATNARKGENRSDWFLEVAVYTMGGRRGLILFPKCRNGWG
jgi:hypothetical protein